MAAAGATGPGLPLGFVPLLAAAFEVSSPQAEMASVVAHKMISFVFENIDFLEVRVPKCAEIHRFLWFVKGVACVYD